MMIEGLVIDHDDVPPNVTQEPDEDVPRLIALGSLEVEDLKWIWTGYIPAGKVMLLDGDGGVGKSLLVTDIMARLTSGRSMPDGTQADIELPIRVAYFNHEDNPNDTILPRAIVAGADIDLMLVPRNSLDTTFEHPKQIEKFISDHGLKFVVFDAWDDYLGATGRQVYEAGWIRSRMNPLIDIARKHDCTIVIVRHLNRKDGAKATARGGGSNAVRNAARHALIAGVAAGDGAFDHALAVHKANLSAEPLTQLYRIEEATEMRPENDGYTVTAPRIVWGDQTSQTADETVEAETNRSGRASTKKDEAKVLLQGFLASGPRPWADVQQALVEADINPRTARRAFNDIAGRTERAGFGGTTWWLLPHHSKDDIPDQETQR